MKLITSMVSIPVAVLATTVAAGCKESPRALPAIALLLPDSAAHRYEAADRPFFEARFKQLCPGVEIVYANANQLARDQQQQAEAALAHGAKVVVVDPVDPDGAATIVQSAQARAIPVISYDRLITGGAPPDYHVAFDDERAGQRSAEALLDRLAASSARPRIAMIRGEPGSRSARLLEQGARGAFDGKATVVEQSVPSGKPEQVQRAIEQVIAAIGRDGFEAVYVASDSLTGGTITALKAAGIDPATRPTCGRGGDIAAIQRILAGEQYLTVYEPIQPLAEKTAELACALFRGQAPPASLINDKVHLGTRDIPAILLPSVLVTATGGGMTRSVADTVIQDRAYGPETMARICKGYEAACAAANVR